MSDVDTGRRDRAGRVGAAATTAPAEDRASVKRKILRKLSKLATPLLASGAIEPPSRPSLRADPPSRTYQRGRKR